MDHINEQSHVQFFNWNNWSIVFINCVRHIFGSISFNCREIRILRKEILILNNNPMGIYIYTQFDHNFTVLDHYFMWWMNEFNWTTNSDHHYWPIFIQQLVKLCIINVHLPADLFFRAYHLFNEKIYTYNNQLAIAKSDYEPVSLVLSYSFSIGKLALSFSSWWFNLTVSSLVFFLSYLLW